LIGGKIIWCEVVIQKYIFAYSMEDSIRNPIKNDKKDPLYGKQWY
jgi:hypothetical protein